MNLDLVNSLFSNLKVDTFVQNFIKELSNNLEKSNNINLNGLKQENCLYQVVELDEDGAYLQNTTNNIVSKETDISKEVLESIGNDHVLRYENGEYIVDEDLTQEFIDSLVDIKEYSEIKNNFLKESNIAEIDANTRYKIERKEKEHSILSYGEDKNTIKVPNQLIPFWAKTEEELHYKNGKFNRDI